MKKHSESKLGKLVKITGGGTPSRAIPEYWDGDIPWVTVKDFTSKRIVTAKENITATGLKNSASNLIPSKSILIPTRMALGKIAINDIPVAINQDIKALQIIDVNKVNLTYLVSYLSKIASVFERAGKGATVKGIKLDFLKDVKIPLPPFDDQIRIATVLTRAEKLIAKREESIKELDKFLKSTFLEMFGTIIIQPGKTYRFDDLKKDGKGTFSNGPFGSDLLTSELNSENGVPVIYIRDIRNGYLDWKSNAFVTQQKAFSLPNCNVIPGDLLIAKVGDPPGIAAVCKENMKIAIITQDVIRLRLDTRIVSPLYLWYFINSDWTAPPKLDKIC